MSCVLSGLLALLIIGFMVYIFTRPEGNVYSNYVSSDDEEAK